MMRPSGMRIFDVDLQAETVADLFNREMYRKGYGTVHSRLRALRLGPDDGQGWVVVSWDGMLYVSNDNRLIVLLDYVAIEQNGILAGGGPDGRGSRGVRDE